MLFVCEETKERRSGSLEEEIANEIVGMLR